MSAHVARPIDDVAHRVVDGRQALEHLLVGRRVDRAAVGRSVGLRRPPPIVDDALDGGAVELMQRAELPGAGAPAIQRRRVDDEHVLEQRTQPGLPARDAVGLVPELSVRSSPERPHGGLVDAIVHPSQCGTDRAAESAACACRVTRCSHR